jgi:L-malate glycosyltransferase
VQQPGPGIHQVLVSASPGDAITNMALGMQELLRRAGPSEIYAHHIAPEYWGTVHSIATYRARHGRNVLIFHASIGQPEVNAFLAERTEPIVLMYHNVTPPELFERHDPNFAQLLALGRYEIEVLRSRVAGAIAASAYNARELETMGYRNVRVVPPVVDVHRLASITPRASTLNHLRSLNAPILLSVGQLMPHKRPDFLVEAMYCAETYGEMGRPVLLLVGHQRLAHFTRAIRQQVRELNVDVHVVGSVDDADLAAMFTVASVVVSASEHEGFCIPLVEAMTLETPVVARACAAIPETVGDAGLLVPGPQGPAFFAEAVGEVLRSPALASDLVARGRARVDALESASADATILDALLEVV